MTELFQIKTAAIVATGDELVDGRNIDTNSAYMADRLTALGVEVVAMFTVGDDRARLEGVWRDSVACADLVVATGGLGPTADDLTTETLAEATGRRLVVDETSAERIRDFFRRFGREMPENNLKQARVPEGAEVIANELGTAPGYRLVTSPGPGDRKAVMVVLPGVPREMRPMFDEQVLPWLAGNSSGHSQNLTASFQVFGLSESAIDERLADLAEDGQVRLGFRASFPTIAVKVSVDRGLGEERMAEAAAEVRARLGAAIYGQDGETMEAVVGAMLADSGLKLATAESCTGGLIGGRLTSIPGSSVYYSGGIVAYSDTLKEKVLGVAPMTLSMFGAVSEETAAEMAQGVCRLTGADLGLAITGIAGPGGGTGDKPVGTVVVALFAGQDQEATARSYRLRGDREQVRGLAAEIALDWVRRRLSGLDPAGSAPALGRKT